jgi:hypothetical protein
MFNGEMAAQSIELTNKFLKERFPAKYFIIHLSVLGIIGIVSIILQSILMGNDAYNSNVGYGIWGGLACIIQAVSALALCKRN